MNSDTSNPDEAKEATDKSTKKNIPGLALLLLDLAVALVGFYIGTHVFWKDQNEESIMVAGAMSAAWAPFSWAVFGPMLGRGRSAKFEKGIFLMSMLASWDAGVAMACVNHGGKGMAFSGAGTSLWLLSAGFVYCWYVACAIIVRDVMPSKFRLKLVPIPLLIGMGLSGLLYYVEGPIHTFIRLMCVVMFWLFALSLAYCWPYGKIGSDLADSASLLEWRYVISSTLFLENEITESITFDNIKDWDPRVKRYLPEFIRNNDIKAKATNAVLDLGGIVPTAVAVFGFGPLKDMKGADGVVLWLCTFVLSLVAGLFAAWRKRYWSRLGNCRRILMEETKPAEDADKTAQATPSHAIQQWSFAERMQSLSSATV